MAVTRRARARPRRSLLRLVVWARRKGLGRRLAPVLTIAAILSGAATYAVMTGWAPVDPDSGALFVLLNLDLALLLVLMALVARRLARLWVERRAGGAGSRLHLRFIGLFSALAVTPAILVAVFSALFFNLGVEAWFGERVRTALAESRQVARAYLAEHQEVIRGQVLAVANDLARNWPELLRAGPEALERYLSTQASVRGLTEAVVFDPSGKVLARAGYTFALQFEEVPFWALEKAQQGEVAVLTGESEDRVRALVELDVLGDLFLYVGRFVDPVVVAHMRATEEAVTQYRALQEGRANLGITFSLIFVVVTLLLLSAAIWVGLSMATRLAKPIGDLIDAAERVRGGDLSTRVPEIAASDEVAVLSRAFNRMTGRIAHQQDRLLDANRQLDDRRRFMEAVLGGVSAGVVSVDAAGRLMLANRSASHLLGLDLEGRQGEPLSAVVPEFAPLVAAAGERAAPVQREVGLTRGARALTFLVRVTVERSGHGDDGHAVVGHILTFDDITALQAAQRTAAWADVARRIAHEIKNPLTPIQLSAERLKRRYLKQIEDGPEVFVQCTDTIVRHVGDIGRMVDEFSAFARMPTPVMRPESLVDLAGEAVVLQRQAFPKITFETVVEERPPALPCDSRQIGQALTNLLKNAVEAIEARDPARAAAEPGRVVVRVGLRPCPEGGVRRRPAVTVEDNGRGLPAEERDRLTEPYVTTRSKGTGLGLAIVKKILEDHGGHLILEDARGGGAAVTLVFPHPDPAAGPVAQSPPADPAAQPRSPHGA